MCATKRKKDSAPHQGELLAAKKFCTTCISEGTDFTITPHHERTSSKICPFYKAPLATRNQKAEVAYAVRCTKIGLHRILRQPTLLASIQDFQRRMTKIHFESSRLANLFVLHELNQGNAICDLSYNSFMRQVFQGVARVSNNEHTPKAVKNNALQFVRDELYSPTRPAGLPWNDDSNLSQCISLAAKCYATNCQNHVIVNWESRIQRWWNIELQARLPFLYASQRKRMAVVFLEGQSEPPTFRSYNDDQVQQILQTYHLLTHQCKTTILVDVTLPVDLEATTSKWWTLLPSLWRLLQALEAGNYPGFTMLPLMGVTAKYVHFDTDAFHNLLRASNVPNFPSRQAFRKLATTRAHLPPENEYPTPVMSDVRVCDHWWAWAFKLNKITTASDAVGGSPTKLGQRRFGYYLSTDGLSTSVQVRVPKAEWVPPTVDHYGFDEEGEYQPLDVTEGDRVIALDPGRISPFTGIYGDAPTDKITCSKLEYRQRAGFTEAQRLRVRWMKNAPDVQRINTGIPTAKTSTTATFQVHLQYTLLHRDTLCSFYGARRWLRLRWKCHIAKEKMWEVMIRRITNGNQRTIVALGDASFAHNSRGHASTPTKELRRRLKGRCRLRMIDEYRTSITCSKCDGSLPKRTRYWQVKVCQDICLTSWNRDVNAARNILAIFLWMTANQGERPWCFRREDPEPS